MRAAVSTLVTILVLSCYAWSLWRSPSFGRLADQAGQLALARDYHRALQDGDFPPRWAATANGGRGSPAFVLYPPMFAALTASIALAGRMDVREAMRWAVMVVVVTTGAGIYYLARAWLSRFRSLLAAGIVLLLPGSIFLCLGRGMYPQFFALLWVALLAGAGLRIVEGQRVWASVVVLTLAGAGLVLTHTITAYLVLLLLLILAPLLWPVLSRRRLSGAGIIALVVLLATAWFWIPQFYAKSYTRSGYLSERHNYLESTWLGPAGGDSAYARDWRFINQVGRMIVVAQVVLASIVTYAGSGGGLFLKAAPWVAGASFLASVRPAAAVLMKLPGYGMVQFCWRWQILLALFCGVALAELPVRRRAALPVALGLVIICFFTPLLWPVSLRPVEDLAGLPAAADELTLYELPTPVRNLYMGSVLETRPQGSDSLYYLPAEPGRAEVVSGQARLAVGPIRTSERTYQVESPEGAKIRVYTYQCPGWRAQIDGTPVAIEREEGSGLQLLRAPPGSHRVRFQFDAAWPR